MQQNVVRVEITMDDWLRQLVQVLHASGDVHCYAHTDTSVRYPRRLDITQYYVCTVKCYTFIKIFSKLTIVENERNLITMLINYAIHHISIQLLRNGRLPTVSVHAAMRTGSRLQRTRWWLQIAENKCHELVFEYLLENCRNHQISTQSTQTHTWVVETSADEVNDIRTVQFVQNGHLSAEHVNFWLGPKCNRTVTETTNKILS